MPDTTDYVIESSQLLVLPQAYVTIKEAIDDPSVGLDEVATLIGNDAAMSARILQVANSSMYGHMAKIDNLPRALTVLGTKTVHDMVLATALAHAFDGLNGIDYDVETFWRESLMRAAIAHACAIELDINNRAHYFIVGLLSDIGHMVMNIREPHLMQRVFQQHRKTGHPLHLYERSTFGFDYGELGSDILQSWALPNPIIMPIRYQNCPELCPEMKIEAAIIYTAARLRPNENEFPTIIDIETLGRCGINSLDYDAIRSKAESLYDEAISLFPLNRLKKAV